MQVLVVSYNPLWPELFESEAQLIRSALPQISFLAHHIGSTSVPGLVAKPIIDILLEVDHLVDLDAYATSMEQIGYEVMGEYGIAGRRYFRKEGNNRTHHIHAFQKGDLHIKRHLAFRDYLRAHDEIAEEYGNLKRTIVQNGQHNINSYADQKDPFIKKHEEKALIWYATS